MSLLARTGLLALTTALTMSALGCAVPAASLDAGPAAPDGAAAADGGTSTTDDGSTTPPGDGAVDDGAVVDPPDAGPPDLGPDSGIEPMRRVLETTADGTVVSGSTTALALARAHRGDLKLAFQDWIIRCTDTATFAGGVSCSSWLPITVQPEGPRWSIPDLPDWELAQLNTSGLVDRAYYRADRHFLTGNTVSNEPLTWFARDWRTPGYAHTDTGTATSVTTRGELIDALLAGQLGTPFAARPAIIRIPGSHVAALTPWRVSLTPTARGFTIDDDASNWFQWSSTTGQLATQRMAFAGTEVRGSTVTAAAGQWWMEPGWTETLVHTASGAVERGSLAGLIAEMELGAEAAVVVEDELVMRCARVIVPVARNRAICTVRGGYSSVVTATTVGFVLPMERELRSVTTEGIDTVEPLPLGQETPPPLLTRRRPARWYTNRAGHVELYATGRRGDPLRGEVAALVEAARAGADVRLYAESETELIVKECHSLKVDVANQRLGCVEFGTRPGQRYWYFGVHSTDGHVRDYRVCEGSSNPCGGFHEITEQTRWIVRR